MTDNEFLLAISDIIDKKLNARLDPIENQLKRTNEKLDTRLNPIECQLHQLQGNVEKLEARLNPIECRLKRIEIDLLENNVIPRLNTIESCYTDTYNRYRDYTHKIESAFTDIQILKQVISEHSETLQNIS